MIHFIYVTAKNKKQARNIGRKLLEERLAACVNIFEKMNSLYWWEGKICDETEAVLIVKTRKKLINKIIVRIKELHSYSCPCILAFPITEGNKEYIRWLESETKK